MIKFLQNSFAHCSNGQSPPRGKLYGVMDTTTCTIVTCLSSKRRRIKYICHNAATLTCGFWAASLEGLDAQLVGDGHEHFEDGHEGGDFAEVAAADHLGVDLQAPLVVLARHAAADLVEPAEDVLGECLLSQLVIQVSQTFGCVIQFPFRLLKEKHLQSSDKSPQMSFFSLPNCQF